MVTYMCRGMFLGGAVTQVPYQEAEPKMVGVRHCFIGIPTLKPRRGFWPIA